MYDYFVVLDVVSDIISDPVDAAYQVKFTLFKLQRQPFALNMNVADRIPLTKMLIRSELPALTEKLNR